VLRPSRAGHAVADRPQEEGAASDPGGAAGAQLRHAPRRARDAVCVHLSPLLRAGGRAGATADPSVAAASAGSGAPATVARMEHSRSPLSCRGRKRSRRDKTGTSASAGVAVPRIALKCTRPARAAPGRRREVGTGGTIAARLPMLGLDRSSRPVPTGASQLDRLRTARNNTRDAEEATNERSVDEVPARVNGVRVAERERQCSVAPVCIAATALSIRKVAAAAAFRRRARCMAFRHAVCARNTRSRAKSRTIRRLSYRLRSILCRCFALRLYLSPIRLDPCGARRSESQGQTKGGMAVRARSMSSAATC
jgi:hypothetical protein